VATAYLHVAFCWSTKVEASIAEVEFTGEFKRPRNVARYFRLVALVYATIYNHKHLPSCTGMIRYENGMFNVCYEKLMDDT